MSITNNNPFLLNIQPVQGSVANATGLDPITTLRSDVDDIQQMVIFGEKRIAIDVISAYNQTKIQVINDINVQNSILSINDVPVGTGGGSNTIINNVTFINVSTSISYGLSTVNSVSGISSLSSVVSYGLSTVYNSIQQLAVFSNSVNPGVSTLSSIVSYGLSSIGDISLNLSTSVSYGLSSIALQPQPGVSSLSSIISYGLSSIKAESGQFLGANTWVAGFYPSSIGGADIYDSNTGNPDTYTVALAKLDAWIYKNIVDQPTAPSYFGQSNSISSINYYWTNPQQFKIGVLNTYAPYISSLHMNLYSNGGLFSTFSYCDPYIPYSGFTVEGVEFVSAESNRAISTYQSSSFSNKNTISIPINTNIFNIGNGPYSLDLYFRNYSSNAFKVLQFGQSQMCNLGFPGPPENISFINITQSNAFIIITKPELHSVTPALYGYPPLSNYKITLRNTTPAPRRYNAIGFTPVDILTDSIFSYIQPVQSNFLGNILTADSTYTATVSSRNVFNITYGESLTSAPFTTPLPLQPGTLTSITSLSNPYTNTQLVFGNISNVAVYNRNIFGVGGLQFITNSGLGIHSSNNPGSSNSNIASIRLIVIGPTGSIDSNTLNLNGFPIVAATASNSNVNTIVRAQNIADFYPGNTFQSNFFMSFTANTILKQDYLTAASNPYTFSITHSNSGFNCNFPYSDSIYVDDLPGVAPLLTNIGTAANSSYFNSGVVSFTGVVPLNFDLSNLARYFYIRDQSLLSGSVNYKGALIQGINCNIGTTLYTTGDIEQTVAPLSATTRIKSAFTIIDNIFTEANATGSRVIATVSLSNLNGSSGTLTSNLPFYIDAQSTRVNQSIIGTTRYASGGGSNSNDNSGVYSNTYLIRGATGAQVNYNVELPFVGGLFRTGAALSNLYDSFSNFTVPSDASVSSYSNLSNYSLIKNETGIRYATFAFNYSAPNTSVYINKVTVTFSNQSGLILINSNYNSLLVPYFSLFSGNNGFGSSSNVINVNGVRTNVSPFQSGFTSGIVGTRIDCNITVNSRTVSIIPYNSVTATSLYIKIGLTMNCNISFQNFNVVFGSNRAPSAPANVSLTNSGNNLTLNWQTPANCNDPLDNYKFSIIASCNSVYPRRYVALGSRITQEPYFSNITCNIFMQPILSSYSFTGVALNYDTPYTGQISLTNDAATSTSVTTGPITTPLPANTLPQFTNATNLDLNAAFKTYYPFCNAFNLCSRTFITNILSNQGTPVVIDYLVNGSISNAFSINNSTNTGSNLSKYSYIGRWFKDGTDTASATSTFQFSNELYLFSNSAGNRVSPTVNGLTVNVSKIQDLYVSGSETGFYLKAYPNLQVNSFSAGRYSNSFSLSNSDGVSLRSGPFYIDNISSAPSITDIKFSTFLSLGEYISGVRVFNSYADLFFYNEITNLAKYYFRSNCISWKLLSNSTTIISNFNFNNSTTPFYNNTTDNLYSCDGTNLGALINPVYIKWGILLNYDVYTPCNCPSFLASACNLIGSSSEVASVFGLRSVNKNILIDSYSSTVKNNTLNSNWSLTGCNYGIRVESGAGTYPSGFGADFNNNISLTDTYINELQLSYGAYRTASNARFNGASKGYLNYNIFYDTVSLPDYSGITTVGTRYVTFKWFVSAALSQRWQTANIGFQFDEPPFYNPALYTFPGIDVTYKIVASNDTEPTVGNLTTAWLNANALCNVVPDANSKNTNGRAGSYFYPGIQNDASNLKVFFPSLNYLNVPFNFFVRIGIPMNCNISLKYCRLGVFSSGVVPGQQQNLTITNASVVGPANALSNTTMSWISQNDSIQIDSFSITYAAVSNGIYPRRYRPAGRVIPDTSNITSNVSIAGVATTSTYLFTPSNYDTYYYGSVIATNATGNSLLASNISVNSTVLPINSGTSFAGTLAPLASVNYPNPGVIFASRSSAAIGGGLIYASNSLFTGGGSLQFKTNNDITINPLGNNIGDLGTVTWNVGLSNVTAGTTLKNFNYLFTNSLFAASQTIVSVNDGSINWTLSNVRDIYNGETYRSGFYGLATPVITLSNTLIPPSSNRYRLTLNDLTQSIRNSNDFYVENLVGAPSGRLDVENTGGINFCNISGVSVITSTTFNFWIATSNIGSFFFYNPPVTASITNISPAFAFDSNATPFYWNCNSTSTYTRSPISNTTYFYWSNVTATTTFGTVYTFTGTVSNIATTGVSLGGVFTPYFDFESVTNMNCNLRVNSGTGLTPELANSFGLNFNNDSDITSAPELQFVRGVYCTNTYGNVYGGYENYVNYFVPKNGVSRPSYFGLGGGTRYTSFLFSNVNPNNTSNKLDTVTLRLIYNFNGKPSISANLYDTNTTFQIRLNNTSSYATTNDSTAWLNANGVGAPTLITKNNNGTNCLTGGINRSNDNTNTYTYDTCSIQIPPGCGYCNMNLYTRVGFNMSAGIALRRIELSSNTVINIPSQFNANLYINSNGTNFFINLLPNLPITTYCNLSASFIYNSATFNATPSQAITSGSNYTFTNFSFSPNACNIFATGSLIIRNNLGTTFYTSNTIQSIDYYVARPISAVISFSPGVWWLNSNYFVGTIQTPTDYPLVGTGTIVYYTVTNDNNSFTASGSSDIGNSGSFSFSNLFTNSNQYLNRAFFMTTYVQGTMRDSSTRLSSNLTANTSGILSPPSGHSNSNVIMSYNSDTGLTLVKTFNFYNSQLFTFPIVSANYGLQTFSNAGFPRSRNGYSNDPNSSTPFVNPIVFLNPSFSFINNINLSVHDTYYNAYLYLRYTNGGTCNTNVYISTGKTGLPTDTRNSLSGASLSFTGTAFPHKGVIGVTQVDVFPTGSVITLTGATNIGVNPAGNPGFVSGCNYNLQITYPDGSYSYTFSNDDYSGKTYIINADANKQLVTQDYTVNNYAKGFYLSFNLNYSHTYNSASAIANTNSLSLNGVLGPTDSRYIDASGGQITVLIGSRNYTSNIRPSCPISVTNLGDRGLTFTNTFNIIKPFIFGNLSFRYNSCNRPSLITNNLLQDYNSISGTSFGPSLQNINNTTLGVVINGCNSIVNYTMSASYSNLATTCNTSVSDSVFNDATDPTTNPNLTISNGNLKWILGAWRADYTNLNFNSTALQGTFGNSGFVLGAGALQYLYTPVIFGIQYLFFTLYTTQTPTSIIAYFPQDLTNPGNGYGTFNCLLGGGPPSTTNHGEDPDTNGILVGRIGNRYQIGVPTQFSTGYFYLWLTINSGSFSNIINS